jgi:hypothetical protein
MKAGIEKLQVNWRLSLELTGLSSRIHGTLRRNVSVEAKASKADPRRNVSVEAKASKADPRRNDGELLGFGEVPDTAYLFGFERGDYCSFHILIQQR